MSNSAGSPGPGQAQGQTPIQGQGLAQGQAQASALSSLGYECRSGLLDDACMLNGEIKPEWRYLLGSLHDLGAQGVSERQQKARRILRDDGASYNIYSGEGGTSSSWELDPVPHVIGSEDWSRIEAGLQERSELFNLILRDLYGPRTLLRYGQLPPEALFGHGGFLRACDGIQMPGEHELILHAADMVRQRDGSMCVLSDRTQVPSGAGYVLENRTVMSRVFPSLYRDSQVHRIATFYQRLRLKLLSLSPTDEAPLIAFLTPGGQNENYFEHSYLASYLGFPLVQAGDLVVRNGFLWMKSMDGLKRVDILLRRVDDVFCDPVELRSDSRLGVPGLLEVVRSGNVVVANPLGSGLLENAIFLKYLPAISRTLLGREPRLASVQTYWCGDEEDLAFVTANIRKLIIKPAYRGSGISSVWGGSLSDEQVDQLLATIRRKRYQYVAQERLEQPHIPAFAQGTLQPRPFLLRTFSVAAESSYQILAGGLTRIANDAQSRVISMQSGCPSKDTWVTATEPERTAHVDVVPENIRSAMNSPLVSLPSRVVENLYWLGRYAERAEASLRLLRTVFVLLNGEEPISANARKILLHTVSRTTATLPGFTAASEQVLAAPEDELLRIIRDGSLAGSVPSTLNAMLASADESKELLSTDTMRVINDLRDAMQELDVTLASGLTSAPEEALDPLVTALSALSGLMHESMIRGIGWRFMELGKRIERGFQIIGIVRSLMTPVVDEQDQATLLNALLVSMEVLITYRRRGRQRSGVQLGLQLVMLDEGNPRSLLFQLERLQQHLAHLPQAAKQGGALDEESRALLEATTSLKLSRLPQLLEAATTTREEMEQLLSRLEKLMQDFNRIVSDKYFDHRIDPQQLVTSFWGEQ